VTSADFQASDCSAYNVCTTTFWESFGYHKHGDPWKEERYDGD
jgi:DMSO/TMAO reductase YedYZ molybdopterin-dependent catalytic subunit